MRAGEIGIVAELMSEPELAPVGELLGLDENASVLCISTEGDTDQESYAKIIGKA